MFAWISCSALDVYTSLNIVQVMKHTENVFMPFSLLCFSCSDHSNLKRMEFVNNASFMVFIVFFNGEKKKEEE